MQRENCFNCRFLVRFTPAEAKAFRAKLAEHGLEWDFFGGCAYTSPSKPLVIRRYLDHPVADCTYWHEGYFHDRLGLACPQCRRGEVVVVRPARDKQTYTLIGCSAYPECRFMTKYLPLKTMCRFCAVPLVLGAGQQLVCYCPRCKRNSVIPLTVAGWPHLFATGDICPHGRPWPKCETCNRSRAQKRNVLDLELPVVAQYELTLRERLARAWERYVVEWEEWEEWPEYYDWWPSDPYVPWEEEWVTELLDDRYTLWARYARSAEVGWFYEDP